MWMKRYLLTPGPTPVPEAVMAAFAQPLVHHRTPDFEKLFESVRADLKYVFQTKNDVLCLAASGTGAMEAAVSNLFSSGDKVLVVEAGKFGERWTEIAKRYGLKPVVVSVNRGRAVSVSELTAAIENNRDSKGILFQACETSTGVRMPSQEIANLAAKNGMLSICDAITGCGVFDLPMDRWGIDVLISGSQKAFMIPPGLAFIALSDRAWAAADSSNLPRYYFDLKIERSAHQKNMSAWTPAISLIQGLKVALEMIRSEGLEALFKRHALLAAATRAGVEALGLELFSKDTPSEGVTAVSAPGGLSGKKIAKTMREKYGVAIASGQAEMEDGIFRLSHFGYVGFFDISTAISALELTLSELGFKVSFGKGVGAALARLAAGNR